MLSTGKWQGWFWLSAMTALACGSGVSRVPLWSSAPVPVPSAEAPAKMASPSEADRPAGAAESLTGAVDAGTDARVTANEGTADAHENGPQTAAHTPDTPAVESGSKTKGAFLVLDAGRGTKRRLRYAYHAGESLTTRIHNEQTNEIQISGRWVQQPTTSTEIETVVDTSRVEQNGTAHCSGRFSSARVLPATGMTRELEAKMNEVLRGLVGLTFRQVVSARGEVIELHFDTESVQHPELRSILDGLAQGMSQFGAVWPEEAVGVGAQWRLTKPFSMLGMTLNQTTTTSLTALEAKRAEIESVTVSNADQQNLSIRGGQSVQIDSMASTSTAHQAIGFDPVATHGTIATQALTEMTTGTTHVTARTLSKMSISAPP